MPSIASSLRARTHHRGHGGTLRSQPSLRSGADEGVRPYTNGGVIAYFRMLGEQWIESWLRFGWGRGKGPRYASGDGRNRWSLHGHGRKDGWILPG